MESVLYNLISNAFKIYTHVGGRVSIELIETDQLLSCNIGTRGLESPPIDSIKYSIAFQDEAVGKPDLMVLGIGLCHRKGIESTCTMVR